MIVIPALSAFLLLPFWREREREKAEDVVYVFELFEHFNKSPGSRCTIAFSVSVML